MRVFKRLSFLPMFVFLISTFVFQFEKISKFFYTTVRVSPPLRVSPGAFCTSRTPSERHWFQLRLCTIYVFLTLEVQHIARNRPIKELELKA